MRNLYWTSVYWHIVRYFIFRQLSARERTRKKVTQESIWSCQKYAVAFEKAKSTFNYTNNNLARF